MKITNLKFNFKKKRKKNYRQNSIKMHAHSFT